MQAVKTKFSGHFNGLNLISDIKKEKEKKNKLVSIH